jgi:ABC-2 type transport system ATP-binding protein
MFRRMRGRDALRFFCRIRAGVDLARAHRIADRLGLDVSRPINQMSTGMRQKLALAITLAPQVAVLMLDEPTSNLDPTVRGEVMAMIAEAKAEGRTVIFSSHVLSEVERVCDRVAILRQGALVHTQAMRKLRRQHRIQARLTGPMPPTPAHFDEQTKVHTTADGRLTIETPGELSSLLGWLAELPLAEVEIEPISLQSVYERYHPAAPR